MQPCTIKSTRTSERGKTQTPSKQPSLNKFTRKLNKNIFSSFFLWLCWPSTHALMVCVCVHIWTCICIIQRLIMVQIMCMREWPRRTLSFSSTSFQWAKLNIMFLLWIFKIIFLPDALQIIYLIFWDSSQEIYLRADQKFVWVGFFAMKTNV